jgi:cytochrome P450 family 12
LAKNPEKQQKLRDELTKVLPEKTSKLTAENMKNLPYLRAVLKEGQRLYPATPGTTRAAGQDLVIQGFQIPKGINLFISTGLISKNDEHYPRSLEFLPERWLRDNQERGCPNARDANPFVYLPFGFGARSCVGRRFAELEIEVLIARMVREFHIEWLHEPIKFKSQMVDVPVGDIKFRLQEVSH